MLLCCCLLAVPSETERVKGMTVGVGDYVNLTCTRQTSDYDATLHWIRLVSGGFPEVLGGTYSFDYVGVNKTPRITAKQEPGTFVLHISETKQSDTGVYYCMKVDLLDMNFINATFLRIKGPEPNITAIVQVPPSDPVRPGDSVTLQCSVFSDSELKICPGEQSVYWFKPGSDESHPGVIYAQRNGSDQCEKSPETHSPQTCVYSFSRNVSSSDAGTYYCAVAACGQILFGNGTKLDIEGNCTIFQDIQDENSLSYSAPTFFRKKAGKAESRQATTAEGCSRTAVYTGVQP
uniref:Ig-like domain-containing protein n=1 Tax=Monopterus albus TaxID=43700 RepID=A0A3Q3K0T0_MONAL